MKLRIISILTVMAAIITSCTHKTSTDADAQAQKPLVLYYSQSGTTKQVAEEIQKLLGADIEAFDVTEPYSGTYDETIARVMKEMADSVLPTLAPIKANLDDYDTIFIGYPIWFGTYAPPMTALLNEYDFAGKTIVPFCTFGSGGLEVSVANIVKAEPEATVAPGYGVRQARVAKAADELTRFLTEQGYLEGEVVAYPDFGASEPVGDAEKAVFDAACSSYFMPLGTPVNVAVRQLPDATEYRFDAVSSTPQGTEATSVIYVLADSTSTEFTRVVR